MDPSVRVLRLDINLNIRPGRERVAILRLHYLHFRTHVNLVVVANEGHGLARRADQVAALGWNRWQTGRVHEQTGRAIRQQSQHHGLGVFDQSVINRIHDDLSSL